MFTIGEFSKITGLTVKTLRFYHEEGLLNPAFIDPQTGYRYYQPAQIELARTIAHLRGMEFPLAEIRPLLAQVSDEEQLLEVLERQRAALEEKIRHFRKVVRSLDTLIHQERQAKTMAQESFEVQEKVLPEQLIAGIRMKGRYCECGQGFSKIGRSLGRYICDKPLLLHYDSEYKEADADFEACMPIRPAKAVEGISIRTLPGGRCVALVHKGPYEQLGQSYARILQYIKDKGYKIATPSREVYLKGPGLIFRGNPKNYLTEIQMMIEEPGNPAGSNPGPG